MAQLYLNQKPSISVCINCRGLSTLSVINCPFGGWGAQMNDYALIDCQLWRVISLKSSIIKRLAWPQNKGQASLYLKATKQSSGQGQAQHVEADKSGLRTNRLNGSLSIAGVAPGLYFWNVLLFWFANYGKRVCKLSKIEQFSPIGRHLNLHQIIWEFNCWRRLCGGSAIFFNSWKEKKKIFFSSVHQTVWLQNAYNSKIDQKHLEHFSSNSILPSQ